MSIKRRVLHHDMFGHPDAERGKVPHRLNPPIYHFIRYILSDINRYCQHTNIHRKFIHFSFKVIGMENRNSV